MSKNVIVPSGCWRASCCHAVRVPGPIVKLECLPPSCQRTIPVPGEAQEIITAPDGKAAYVSCDSRVKDTQAGAGDGVVEKRIGQVAVIDLAQWKVEFLIDAGAGADGLAWVPAP